MSLREEFEKQAARRGATIVFPEPSDERIVAAAREVAARNIAEPLLVGRESEMPAELDSAVWTEVIEDSDKVAEFSEKYAEQRGVKLSLAERMVTRPLVYGAMLVSCGYADGMVAGISHATGNVLQAAGLAIGYREGISTPSSCFIIVIPELRGEKDVPVVFADCAVCVDPDAQQLGEIALASAQTARRLLNVTPRVAMLSFSTKGSASHPTVDKVRKAAEIAENLIEEGFVEGELQADAALNPAVARKKMKGESEVAGRANVLIFPDLNAGNIAYKAVQQLGGAAALGPILQGFAKPVNDLSRGASVEDVVSVTAITVLLADL